LKSAKPAECVATTVFTKPKTVSTSACPMAMSLRAMNPSVDSLLRANSLRVAERIESSSNSTQLLPYDFIRPTKRIDVIACDIQQLLVVEVLIEDLALIRFTG
jgi:hypothetical protein